MQGYENAPSGTITRARDMRRNPTDAERRLWNALRYLPGTKFRRQVPVTPYFVDFMDHGARLIVELDGGQHADEAAIAYDARRTTFLAAKGYRVLRFWNTDVMQNPQGVLEAIVTALKPSPPGRGRGPAALADGRVRATPATRQSPSPSHGQTAAGPSLSPGRG